MSYQGDIRLGATIEFTFTTRRFSTGAPYALAGTPSIEAYQTGSSTPITAGVTLTTNYNSVTGLNHVSIAATEGNGFATAKDVSVVIAAGTVDSVSVVGETIGSFSIENRSAVMPTTPGRTLDISAGGEAGVDWANVGSPTTTVNLSATTVGSVTATVNATLVSTGLDAISTTAPAGVASNFREMMVQLWRRFFKKMDSDTGAGTIKSYADNGTSVLTTQAVTIAGTTTTVGAAT